MCVLCQDLPSKGQVGPRGDFFQLLHPLCVGYEVEIDVIMYEIELLVVQKIIDKKIVGSFALIIVCCEHYFCCCRKSGFSASFPIALA